MPEVVIASEDVGARAILRDWLLNAGVTGVGTMAINEALPNDTRVLVVYVPLRWNSRVDRILTSVKDPGTPVVLIVNRGDVVPRWIQMGPQDCVLVTPKGKAYANPSEEVLRLLSRM